MTHARHTLMESGSELLIKVLTDKKFTHKKDDKGRVLIDCSQEVAKSMEHFMCHNAVYGDEEVARAAAEYFLSERFSLAVEQKLESKNEWKWKKIEIDFSNAFFSKKQWSFICPICDQLLSFLDDSSVSLFSSVIVHLTKSHNAELLNLSHPNPSCSEKWTAFIKCKSKSDSKADENKFTAKIIQLPYMFRSGKLVISCHQCSGESSEGLIADKDDKQKEEKAVKHFQTVHQAALLYYAGDEFIVLLTQQSQK